MGKEQRATLAQTLQMVKDAIRFRIGLENGSDMAGNDRLPMTPLQKKFLAISILLHPSVLKEWIGNLSSFRYGEWILGQAFPKIDNPEPYHSTEFEVDLRDHPVQKLGWKEVDSLKQEGVKEGLDKLWINRGFFSAAEKMGIDPEWHFAQYTPVNEEQNQSALNTTQHKSQLSHQSGPTL